VKSENVVEHKVPPTGGVKAPPPGLTKQPSHINAVNGKYCNCVYMHVDVTVFVHLVCIFLCISDSGVIFYSMCVLLFYL